MQIEDLVDKVKILNFGDEDLDKACYVRLEKLARDSGNDGKFALKLLPIIAQLLKV